MNTFPEITYEESLRREAKQRGDNAYDMCVPDMTRKERRSKGGKQLIEQGRIKALEAENKFLKQQLGIIEND